MDRGADRSGGRSGDDSRRSAAGTSNGAAGSRRAVIERQILDAAAQVFAEAGFEAARTASVAERAGLPKANVLYYFGTKAALYERVLARVLDRWVGQMDVFQADADPAEALRTYVRAKVELSRQHPIDSRVFANEVLHGAPFLRPSLKTRLKQRVDEIAEVFAAWRAAGKIGDVDPRHLLFTLWAATQTYADFDAQIVAVLGGRRVTKQTFDEAADHLEGLVLRGCGLPPGSS